LNIFLPAASNSESFRERTLRKLREKVIINAQGKIGIKHE
jgi:hypothetical protein